MGQQARQIRTQVKKNTVRDKFKLVQNFLQRLRFLADEVERAARGYFTNMLENRASNEPPRGLFLPAATQHPRCVHLDDES